MVSKNSSADIGDLDRLIPSLDALKIILDAATALGEEWVPLTKAGNRILACDLEARRTQPPFDASAMDGYAVGAQDVADVPATLEVIGESRAGEPYSGRVESGQAVRIFTGGALPEGSDTVVMQENCRATGNKVEIQTSASKGKFVRKAGLDFREGDILLYAGELLNPARLALAASMNHARIPVIKQPKVAILATGDELVLPGRKLGAGQIIASNSFGLVALAAEHGAQPEDMGIAIDTIEALEQKFGEAINGGADIIVTAGGASVGDHDLVHPAAIKTGFDFHIAKIAMRPGKPFLFATRKSGQKTTLLVGLAGNPVSSLVAGQVFLRPLIRKLAGFPESAAKPLEGVLGRDLPQNDEREEYMRAEVVKDGDRWVVTPFDRQDSSMLATLVRADGLMIRPPMAPPAKAGAVCQFIPLRALPA